MISAPAVATDKLAVAVRGGGLRRAGRFGWIWWDRKKLGGRLPICIPDQEQMFAWVGKVRLPTVNRLAGSSAWAMKRCSYGDEELYDGAFEWNLQRRSVAQRRRVL